MAKQLRINISFPKYEKHIYDFLDQHDNASALVRQLVGAYMSGNLQIVQGVNNGAIPIIPPQQTRNNLKEEVVEKKEEPSSSESIITKAPDITKNGIKNLAKLRDIYV